MLHGLILVHCAYGMGGEGIRTMNRGTSGAPDLERLLLGHIEQVLERSEIHVAPVESDDLGSALGSRGGTEAR